MLLVAPLIAALACGAAPRPESLLLVTVDTLRADVLGAYGGSVSTPALDRLAREGVVVEGACTPTPSTGPAHASLFTGLYPWNHGILLNAKALDDPGLPMLAETAQRAGLETAAFVSSFVVSERWGFDRGFDLFSFQPSRAWRWQGEARPFYSDADETTRDVLTWLEDRSPGPFLAWIHYFDPHSPYRPVEGHFRPRERIDLTGKSLPPKVESLADLMGLIRAYRAEVAFTDEQLGRVLEALDAHGLADSTAVIVTADHGEGLGDHGWLGHGRNLHDELVRVPLIVRAPGLPAGRRLRGPAQLEDLMPTLLSLLGVEAPPGLDGVDLSPWLRGELEQSPRREVLGRMASYPDRPPTFFRRRWPEKWIGESGGEGFGYRLDEDPREARPAAQAPPEALAPALARAAEPVPARELDETSRRALEALGYLEPDGGGVAPE